ncbi:MAG TPA: CHRD domain-containing protein [Actinomycetes bacterium]|nr:CHRD domain-containing protein [Actinomycetes bacterium]
MRRVLLPLAAAAAAALAAGALAPAVSASPSGRTLTAVLIGANEVPGPADPDGSGVATVEINPGQNELCYTITVTDIDPARAAHIHAAPAGVNGPVVVPLVPPTEGSSVACTTSVDPALLKAIKKNPESYYVNVHNLVFPAGAIRGQLTK